MSIRTRWMVAALAIAATGCGDGGGGGDHDGGAGDGAPASDGGPPDAAGPLGTPFAFVASTPGDAIEVYAVDPDSGALTATSSAEADGPTFLAFDPVRGTLYAAEEDAGSIASFAVDATTGALSFIDRTETDRPVHILVDPSGGHLLTSSYADGSATVLPIRDDGGLDAASDHVAAGANAHQIALDPSGAYAFVPCLGSDHVAQYVYDAAAGTLTPNAVATVATADGAGPRHLAFDPAGEHAYLINERDSTMTELALDGATGRLTAGATASTLPAGFDDDNSTAEVIVHPDGRLLYGSNRGDDSIVRFALADDGAMTLIGHTPSGGAHPRHFSIEPTGRFLYAANRDSDAVQRFAIDGDGGGLTPIGAPVEVEGPTFVAVFYR